MSFCCRERSIWDDLKDVDSNDWFWLLDLSRHWWWAMRFLSRWRCRFLKCWIIDVDCVSFFVSTWYAERREKSDTHSHITLIKRQFIYIAIQVFFVSIVTIVIVVQRVSEALWMFQTCSSRDDVLFRLSALILAAVLSLEFMRTEVRTLWLELMTKTRDILNIVRKLLIVEAIEAAVEVTVDSIVNN